MAMIFLKLKMAIFMVKIRSKVCCHFGRMSQGDIVGRVSAQYHNTLHNKRRNFGAKFKILKLSNRLSVLMPSVLL
jgi:hypothetical protein